MDPRIWFSRAGLGFAQLVEGLDVASLDGPGLGAWDLRALLGHTTRAFLTIEQYLANASSELPPDAAPTLDSAADYFAATSAGLADAEQVRQRGVDAGAALGDRPASAALEIAARVTGLVADASDEALVVTPVGVMRLDAYLPTRAFELTVHSLDLARATDRTVPESLAGCIPPAVALCVDLLGAGRRVELLRALTGRGALPDGFSVLEPGPTP